MAPKVTLLATAETKSAEIGFLCDRLSDRGLDCAVIDLSLNAQGAVLAGSGKLDAMDRVATQAMTQLATQLSNNGASAVIGLGGGTGGEIVLKVMRSLPITFPKVLLTTLPFDPRAAVADNSIILVPTLTDISGLNTILCQALENAAALTSGLCAARRIDADKTAAPSIALTALGATEAAVILLNDAIRARGGEATVFHANGYGGAAFARFVEERAFDAIIDLTPHELTRMVIAGAHVAMPTRFTAAARADLPQIVLPGALNFVGLEDTGEVPEPFGNRAHYAHSGRFTHVKLSENEMAKVAESLITYMNAAPTRCQLVVPMGGFSHQDGPGGAIEDETLRDVFLSTARATADPALRITVIDDHIGSVATTQTVLDLLSSVFSDHKDIFHARS